jgi:uroporphyrinogen III methyltransferase/synthase
VIVVGSVAAETHDWFERRPLFGRRVVVTRARAQASTLVDRLGELGAAVVEAPAIVIDDPADGGASLRQAVTRLAGFDWVVFTSPNGVARTFEHVPDARAFGSARVAAIGPGTADALADRRIVADLVPERFVAEGLLEVFPPAPPTGGRVLLARAAVARDVLPEGLRASGWEVEVAEAYRTRPVAIDHETRAAVAEADAVTFTSSSTVTNFCAALDVDPTRLDGVPPVVVSIGPVTSATARERGLKVTAEASDHTIDGVVEAVLGVLPAPTPERPT